MTRTKLGVAQPAEWNETWALAVVFGLASVPWTYAFVTYLGVNAEACIASGRE